LYPEFEPFLDTALWPLKAFSHLVLRSSANQYKQRLKDDAEQKVRRKPKGGKTKVKTKDKAKEKAKEKAKGKGGVTNVNANAIPTYESHSALGFKMTAAAVARTEDWSGFNDQARFELEGQPAFESQPTFEGRQPEFEGQPVFEGGQTFEANAPAGIEPRFGVGETLGVSEGDVSMGDGVLGDIIGDLTNLSLSIEGMSLDNAQGKRVALRAYMLNLTNIFR
jgi:hypothetical protein